MFGYTADFALLAIGAFLGLPLLLVMGNGRRGARDPNDPTRATLVVAE